MTHGCGSVSSAGASFSSFNTGTSAAVLMAVASSSRNSRTSRSRNNSDCDCEECCKGLYHLCLGYLFCTKQMKKSTRIQLAWFWMISLAVALALILGVGVFGAKEFPAAFTDMRMLTEGYSTFMCDGFKLTSSEQTDVYLMPETPQIDTSNRQSYNMTSRMSIPGKSYEYWGFYLLSGSEVTVYSCSDSPVTLLVIKGLDNLHTWMHDDACSGCVQKRQYIQPVIFCTLLDTSGYSKLHLSASESDDYYFLYVTRYSSSEVSAAFYVDRTLYNLSSATQHCANSYECFFELSYLSAEEVVYHVRAGALPSTVNLKSHCLPRIGLYIAFFIIPPLAMAIFLTLLIRKKCVDPTRVSERQNRTRRPRVQLRNEGPTARTPLLNPGVVSGQPRSGSTPLLNPVSEQPGAPPKYEDLERSRHMSGLPSYEESMNAQRK